MRLKKAAALTLVTAMTASMAAGCGRREHGGEKRRGSFRWEEDLKHFRMG